MTQYLDQFWIIDPYDPPQVGTLLEVRKYTLTDQDNDGDIGTGDTINGQAVQTAYYDETVTVETANGNYLQVIGTTFYLADGSTVFTPTDGSVLEEGYFFTSEHGEYSAPLDVNKLGPPCLTTGTLIETDKGPVKVEKLRKGDLVRTEGGQYQTLRLVLNVTFNLSGTEKDDRLLPVRITAGALGNGLPRRDLLVSRQHRMLVNGPIVLRKLGLPAVLIAAHRLTQLAGIYIDNSIRAVTYYHLVFDKHEVVFAEGAATESLYTGHQALRLIPEQALREILSFIPGVADPRQKVPFARPILNEQSQQEILDRFSKQKGQAIVQVSA